MPALAYGLAAAASCAALALGALAWRLERRLRNNHARMSAVLEAAADAIVVVDEQGRVTLFNPAACSIFGRREADTLGLPLTRLLPGLDEPGLARRLQAGVVTGGRGFRIARFETEGRRNGDVAFPVEVSLTRIDSEGAPRYTCVVRDVTDRREAEEALRLFRRAVDASNHGVVISSMLFPGEPIVYANPAFERLTGYPHDEVIGVKCSILQGAERGQPAVGVLREAIARGAEATVTIRNWKRDGTSFWNELSIAPVLDPDGRITHYVGIQTDVTARIEAEQAVLLRSRQLDAIFSLSPDGFVLLDAGGQVAYANPAFERMTGIEAGTLAGRVDLAGLEAMLRVRADPSAVIPPLPAADSERPDLLELVAPQRRTIARLVRRDGHGEVILHYRDVTREREVDRMKSEFLSTAAHELRTPMASILGFSELLLHREYPADRVKSMLATINRQAALLVGLVGELLDLARIEARSGLDFRIEPQPLEPLLRACAEAILMPGDARRVELALPQGGGPAAAIDAEKTSQAITNLLSNAYKYSPGGGRIRLELLTEAGNGEVGVRVTDEGIGMTPEQAARAFERFYRADPSGNIPGTGLGLSLVKEIVELQRGRIELRSAPGAGTTVTLWLPVHGADEAPAIEVWADGPAASNGVSLRV